jgi:hypothetical protein
MSRFIADPNYVEQVYRAIEMDNPNDPAEEMDLVAIAEVANYLQANDYEPFELVSQDKPIGMAYFLYDAIKWTNANK